MQTEHLQKIRMMRRLSSVLRALWKTRLESHFGSVFYFTGASDPEAMDPALDRFISIRPVLFLNHANRIRMLPKNEIQIVLTQTHISSDCIP